MFGKKAARDMVKGVGTFIDEQQLTLEELPLYNPCGLSLQSYY